MMCLGAGSRALAARALGSRQPGNPTLLGLAVHRIGQSITRIEATSSRSVGSVQQSIVVTTRPAPAPAPAQQPAVEVAAEAQPEGPLGSLQQAWDNVDVKQKIVLACSMAFCLSNADKTLFTLAVLPMAVSYGWSPTMVGVVQSAFFYGFLLMQLPGGQLATRLGGAHVLPKGLAVWSGATAAMPLVASSMPALCVARGVMGAGEAVAPSAIINMIANTVPNHERASAVSFAFGGLHVGSILGLLLSPVIIQAAGVPALFYTFGLAGMGWLAWFQSLLAEVQLKDPELAARLVHVGAPTPSTAQTAAPVSSNVKAAAAAAAPAEPPIPYRAFLRSRPVQVLMFTHFCHNWFHYVMLSWLPTYFTSALHVDLMHAAQTALLPPMAGIAASAAAGSLGDGLLARGMPVATVRRLMQSIAFLVPTACMAAVAQIPCDAEHSGLVVACVTAALGMSSFSLAGLYCTHGDMSSKYSSAMLGLTNVAGSLPGIVGVSFVGALYDQTHDWNLALFGPSALMMLLGTAVYAAGSAHEAIDFDAADNSEFAFERGVKQLWSASPLSKAARHVADSVDSLGARVRGAFAVVRDSAAAAVNTATTEAPASSARAEQHAAGRRSVKGVRVVRKSRRTSVSSN